MIDEARREVRSYHKAFSGELTLHRLGRDFVLWRPVAVRQIAWTLALVIGTVFFLKTFGLDFPMWSLPWFFVYVGVPCGLGWLFARADVEGRRLHVLLFSASRHAFRSQGLAGGYRQVAAPNRTFRAKRIRVEDGIRVRRPLPLGTIVSTIFVIAATTLLCVLFAPSPHPAKPAATPSSSSPSLATFLPKPRTNWMGVP